MDFMNQKTSQQQMTVEHRQPKLKVTFFRLFYSFNILTKEDSPKLKKTFEKYNFILFT